jgi:hypothetical protein
MKSPLAARATSYVVFPVLVAILLSSSIPAGTYVATFVRGVGDGDTALRAAALPSWHLLPSSSGAPSIRDRFGMAFDAADNETVLFGGFYPHAHPPVFSDTWTFRSGVWTKLNLTSHPSARASFGMTYDPAAGGVLLFGGEKPGTNYNDTWLFSSGTWTQLTPAHSPSTRSNFSMAYNPGSSSVVLFAGEHNGHDLSDTWTFNGTDWRHQMPSNHPAGRQFAAMANFGTGNETLLVGGLNSSRGGGGQLFTWFYHGGAWTSGRGTLLSRYFGMACTLPSGSVILFGGFVSTGVYTNNTWEFTQAGWMVHHYSNAPSPRMAGGLVYDAADGYTLQFGGVNTNWLNDTWALY